MHAILLTLLATITLLIPLVGHGGQIGPRLEIVRGPYLQRVTPSEAVVRWRTDRPSGTWLALGPLPDELWTVISDPSPVLDHRVAVQDLEAAHRYYYAVGEPGLVLTGGDQEHVIRTPPEGGGASPTRVWVLGDSGTADHRARAVRDGYRMALGGAATDVWVMVGDNAYPDGTEAEYQAAVFEVYPEFLMNTALWPALGNHDARSSDSASQTGPFFDLFDLPDTAQAGGAPSGTEAYYSFDHGDVHFVCLDTAGSSLAAAGTMLQWLGADLAANRRHWSIVYFHHPPYTKGSHDSDDPAEPKLFDVRQVVVPMLERFGADLVLSGHSHSYERSFLLDGHYGTSDTLEPGTMILDEGDGRPDGTGAYVKNAHPRSGTVYVVAGSSGKTGSGTFDHPAMYAGISELGSVALEVAGERLDAWMIDTSGSALDWFTLVKPHPLFVDGFESGTASAWSGPSPRPSR